MIRVPHDLPYHSIAIADANDPMAPAKSGEPTQSGTTAAPVTGDAPPVDENGPEPQSAPLPNADAPRAQGFGVPDSQTADTAPGLTDIEFAELKSIFEYLQKTSVTRGQDAKQIYKEAAKAIWQKYAKKISAQQRAEFNKLPAIR